MWRTAAILAAIAAFLYVAVAGVKWLQPRIAEDIEGRTTTALAQHGMLWADVTVDGRTVVLSGEAPSDEAAEEAATVVRGVFGVASVSNTLLVGEAKGRKRMNSNYQIVIRKEGETLNIMGEVPDASTEELINRLAKTHYADSEVSTSLVVAQGAPAGWRSAVGTVLFNLTQFENVTATVIGDKIRINGEVLDTTYSDAASSAIRAAIPTAYNMKMDIEVVTPTEVMAEAEPEAAEEEPAPADEAKADEARAEEPVMAKESKLAAVQPAAGPAKADEAGVCADLDSVNAEVVHFGFDSAKLRADQKPTVARVAHTVKCNGGKVEVNGYTDATGNSLYNVWLSEQRAESTVRGLIRKGVARENTVARGMGAENPVAPNDTRANRQKNRRVEFKAM